MEATICSEALLATRSESQPLAELDYSQLAAVGGGIADVIGI